MKAPFGAFQGLYIVKRLAGIDAIERAELRQRPAAGERGEEVGHRNSIVGAQAPFHRRHLGQILDRRFDVFCRQITPIQEMQEADARRRRVGAAAAHRGDFDVATVLTPARRNETEHVVLPRHRLAEQLETETDEEGVIRAARSRAGRLVVSVVLGAETLQRRGHALRPIGWAPVEHIDAAACLNQDARIEERKEIDDAGLLSQATAQITGRPRADFRRQYVERGQATQGEAGVVEVGFTFTSGEAAVGILA